MQESKIQISSKWLILPLPSLERSVRLETEEGVSGVCINLKSYGPMCYF
jgi:hypothetical protein